MYCQVLSTFAKHFQTMEKIPIVLLEKLHDSKNIFCASQLQNQVCYSVLDQVYHSGKLKKSSTDILREIQEKYYGLPYVENTVCILFSFNNKKTYITYIIHIQYF